MGITAQWFQEEGEGRTDYLLKKHGGKENKKTIAIASEIGVQRKHEIYFIETKTIVSLGKNSGKGLDVFLGTKRKELF